MFLALYGPNTFFPLACVCKKQTSQSHSSPEAEMVALDLAVRKVGIPSLALWETITERKIRLHLREDNQTCATIIKSGKSNELRHVKRVHGVNICTLHDHYQKKLFTLGDCHTHAQCADIFTKYFDNDVKWIHAKRLIGVLDAATSQRLLDNNNNKKNNNFILSRRSPSAPRIYPPSWGEFQTRTTVPGERRP